jgi:hypothetical protein
MNQNNANGNGRKPRLFKAVGISAKALRLGGGLEGRGKLESFLEVEEDWSLRS